MGWKKAIEPLTWVPTPALGQGRAGGGNAATELFEGGGSRRRRSLLETLVREICQNSTDQRIGPGPAEVSFDLLLLRGDERDGFLRAMDWEGLRPHLAAVRGSGGAAMTLRAGLRAVEAETLVCLRISDCGTAGLDGDDWDEDGNFRRLCIQNFSTGEQTGRGGSFGLGKAVSWLHSRLLTVLFSSTVSGQENRGLRIFGRSEVPARELSGEQFLDGAYLGVASKRDGISVALSDWRSPEEASELCMAREVLSGSGRSGTSLLITAFHEADRDDVGNLGIRDPEEICRDLTEAAAKWFWPAISWGRLSVRARVFSSCRSRPDFESLAEVSGLWTPFLAASRVEPDGGPALVPGDSASTDIQGFPLPARIQPVERPRLLHPALETIVRVGVTRVSPREASLPCRSTIALIRGAGMVVDYANGLPPLQDSGCWCAVALVGSALYETPQSAAPDQPPALPEDVEEYFRAAEPATHDDWCPTTRRLRESYEWRGSAGRLRGLRSEVRQILAQRLLSTGEPEPDTGPELLMRMLSLGEVPPARSQAVVRGGTPRLEVRIDREGSRFDREQRGWFVQGELIRHDRAGGSATAGLSFRSITDSGQGEAWRISDPEVHGPRKHLNLDASDGRRLVFSVNRGFTTVPFRCLVRPPAGVDPDLTGFRQGG
ncbi:MAG: hypothetical protein ERJ68_00410 [Aphanocapsa feldmannii 277cI]|uniref:Uncharacterized protein n=1 Tax=Aphanocapsa feldmannii 277cI TaxID=2507554 RepID=A0A524RVQ9_9CHRO|nr:MAG: hypothetical protein ERJ68_00410 [Aphanocapsa feldmannii 277cI]